MTKPSVAFVGASGVGKTTQLARLVGEFRRRGLRPAVVKHTHHLLGHKPGSDTQRHGDAGAEPVVLSGPDGLHYFGVLPLESVVAWLAQGDVDLVLVEGGKTSSLSKIELLDHTRGFSQPLLPREQLTAVLGDVEIAGIPRLDPDNPGQWADFLLHLWYPEYQL